MVPSHNCDDDPCSSKRAHSTNKLFYEKHKNQLTRNSTINAVTKIDHIKRHYHDYMAIKKQLFIEKSIFFDISIDQYRKKYRIYR